MSGPNSIDRQTRRLLCQLAALEAAEKGIVTAMCADRLKSEVYRAASDLREEMAAPIKITPWSPSNTGNTR